MEQQMQFKEPENCVQSHREWMRANGLPALLRPEKGEKALPVPVNEQERKEAILRQCRPYLKRLHMTFGQASEKYFAYRAELERLQNEAEYYRSLECGNDAEKAYRMLKEGVLAFYPYMTPEKNSLKKRICNAAEMLFRYYGITVCCHVSDGAAYLRECDITAEDGLKIEKDDILFERDGHNKIWYVTDISYRTGSGKNEYVVYFEDDFGRKDKITVDVLGRDLTLYGFSHSAYSESGKGLKEAAHRMSDFFLGDIPIPLPLPQKKPVFHVMEHDDKAFVLMASSMLSWFLAIVFYLLIVSNPDEAIRNRCMFYSASLFVIGIITFLLGFIFTNKNESVKKLEKLIQEYYEEGKNDYGLYKPDDAKNTENYE